MDSDVKSDSTVVVEEDANQRNGNHVNVNDNLLDSDRFISNTERVEVGVDEVADVVAVADSDADVVAVAVDTNHQPSPPPTKGFGLKKWRRIRRNDRVTKETESESEREKDYESDSATGRILKRVLNTNENDGSIIFNAGAADSDNSEDSHSHSRRSSSKSSTAASYPKIPVKPSKNVLPNKLNLHSDPSKKARAPLDLELDKDNSPLSSMESDSRSSFPNPQHPPPHLPSHQQESPAVIGTKEEDDPLVRSILMLQSAQLALQAGLLFYFY